MPSAGEVLEAGSDVEWIKKGGTGRWQMGVMPAYSPRVPDADIDQLADFIVSLKK